MFNAFKRGPASIHTLALKASFSLTVISRSSPFLLAAQTASRSAITSRHLQTSASFRREAEDFATEPEDPRETGTKRGDGPLLTQFQELADQGFVHPNVIKQITDVMGHKTMTPVQTMTINETLRGTDV
jgi:hypothetical protein